MVVERERARRAPRRRVSVVGILGELFITAGVLVLMFLGWQVWLGNLIDGNAQKDESTALSQGWNRGQAPVTATSERPEPGPPVVGTAPGNAEQFGNMIIPRFGADYIRPIAEGIGVDDVLRYGVGHYPGTAMPGAVGNAAFAAHRTGHGSPFFDIDKLQIGDAVYIETEAGWYRYLVRSLEYVQPTGVGVLAPVPQAPGVTPTDRILTLTSCNPVYTASERIVVYGVYDTWFPRAGGAPAEIAAIAGASS
ncbi:MAG: class E sortase [Micrococcales bacterium 70-64]|nr:class E sortase [Leifsonia sp.]ODU63684.1 MAG: class E sortase [Leifsonia sp. SCN 70-46]OJX85375.1 MAG: class E sortase [Micrococcales bacterium 70-64]